MSEEKILVVDDERVVRDIFTTAFDEYRVVTVSSAQEAMDILRRPNDIDLVVSDMMMPGLKGTDLLKEIKRINPNHKVIILTGYSSKEVAIEALRSGADEYIEKPFDIAKTKQVFERLLINRRKFNEGDIGGTKGRIRQAQRFIKRNFDKSLSLKDVSSELFLSSKYFSRIFKEKTGKSFNEYRLSLRIEEAKKLLKKSSYTITQIAYKIGYQNPGSFMKMFKNFTRLTPSQYRRRLKARKRKTGKI